MKRAEERAWQKALAEGTESFDAFDYAFNKWIAKRVASLVEKYGLAATLSFLSMYQYRVRQIYDFSFLKTHGDIEVPRFDDEDVINRIVEDALRNTPVVENYIIHCDDDVLAGDLTGEFRIKVFDDIPAVIPEWEASAVIAWMRADIEAERAHSFQCVEKDERSLLGWLECEYGANAEDALSGEELEKLRDLPPAEWLAIFGGEKPPDDELERFFAH